LTNLDSVKKSEKGGESKDRGENKDNIILTGLGPGGRPKEEKQCGSYPERKENNWNNIPENVLLEKTQGGVGLGEERT